MDINKLVGEAVLWKNRGQAMTMDPEAILELCALAEMGKTANAMRNAVDVVIAKCEDNDEPQVKVERVAFYQMCVAAGIFSAEIEKYKNIHPKG